MSAFRFGYRCAKSETTLLVRQPGCIQPKPIDSARLSPGLCRFKEALQNLAFLPRLT